MPFVQIFKFTTIKVCLIFLSIQISMLCSYWQSYFLLFFSLIALPKNVYCFSFNELALCLINQIYFGVLFSIYLFVLLLLVIFAYLYPSGLFCCSLPACSFENLIHLTWNFFVLLSVHLSGLHFAEICFDQISQIFTCSSLLFILEEFVIFKKFPLETQNHKAFIKIFKSSTFWLNVNF